MPVFQEIPRPGRPRGTDQENIQQMYRYQHRLAELIETAVNTIGDEGDRTAEQTKVIERVIQGESEKITQLKSVTNEMNNVVNQTNVQLNNTIEQTQGLANRLGNAETNIKLTNDAILLKASKAEVDELGGRVSQAEILIDGANAAIGLKANRTEVDAVSQRLSQAEILIDGANAAIALKANREEVEGLSGRISEAEILIDGANAAILLKASQETVDALTNRLSQAEIDINGAEALIALKASQSDVDSLGKRLSQAEIDINGAEAAIALKADARTVTDMGKRLSAAEVDINGLEGQITLLATKKEVSAVSEILSSVQVDLNAAEAAISLKASQSSVNALGERVTSAELLIDGQNSKIAAKADNVRVEALETEITGLLKVENLQAAIASLPVISNGSIQSDNIDSTHIECQSLDVNASLSAGSSVTIGGKTAATEDWVKSQGYLKADASNIATRSWVIENYATVSDVSKTLDGYVMTGELDGYATEAWVRENFSKASTAYMPTTIERYGSVSRNNIPVRALNVNGEELLTGTVDAGDVYDNGWDSGYGSGYYDACPTSVDSDVSYNAGDLSYDIAVTVYSDDGTSRMFPLDSVSAVSAYNSGWNECRSNAYRQQVLINYYPAGETLYDRDGYVATGPWYKGTEAYRYTLPGAKP